MMRKRFLRVCEVAWYSPEMTTKVSRKVLSLAGLFPGLSPLQNLDRLPHFTGNRVN